MKAAWYEEFTVARGKRRAYTRDQQISLAHYIGYSWAEIARMYGMTRDHAKAVGRKMRAWRNGMAVFRGR